MICNGASSRGSTFIAGLGSGSAVGSMPVSERGSQLTNFSRGPLRAASAMPERVRHSTSNWLPLVRASGPLPRSLRLGRSSTSSAVHSARPLRGGADFLRGHEDKQHRIPSALTPPFPAVCPDSVPQVKARHQRDADGAASNDVTGGYPDSECTSCVGGFSHVHLVGGARWCADRLDW